MRSIVLTLPLVLACAGRTTGVDTTNGTVALEPSSAQPSTAATGTAATGTAATGTAATSTASGASAATEQELDEEVPAAPQIEFVAPLSPSAPAAAEDTPEQTSEPTLGDAGTEPLLGTGDLTVLVIADLSGSMALPWGSGSRWTTASDTLLRELAPLEEWLTIGAIFFPVGSDCVVTPFGESPQIPFMSGAGFVGAWRDSVAAQVPTGSTPLGLAFRVADDAIAQADARGLLEQRFRVVVLTDGEPNCDTEPGELEQFAAKWYGLGVETLILGLPGSGAAQDLLNRIAAAGGTGEYRAQEDEGEFGHEVGAALR